MIEQQTPEAGRAGATARAMPVRQWAQVRLRAWLIGLLLIPLINFWVEYTEIISQGPSLASMSLPVACAFTLLVLVPINLLLKRFAPKAAFTQSELILVFLMNTVSIGIGGVGFLQFLTPSLVGWSHYADSTNHWSLWHHLVRPWAVPSPSVIPDYFTGQSTLFTRAHLIGWAQPIAVWSGFIFVLLTSLYCIAVLMRRHWVENERLAFPLVQIPLEITANGGDTPLWRKRLFWIGIAVPAVLETINTLHFTLFPALPYIRLKPEASLQLDLVLTQPPWNGLGYMVFAFYPLVIGLTFLLPVDVSFSCWFFYLLTKLENVATVALGYRGGGGGPSPAEMPYIDDQAIGAFIGLSLLSLYWARPTLAASFRKAFRGDRSVDDSDEPLSYRVAYLGLLCSFVALIGFGIALGLSPLVAFEFFGLFLIMGLALTRIRAEAGLPWAFGPADQVHGAIVTYGGTSALTSQEMTGLSFLNWSDYDWRCLPQGAHLDSMKLISAEGREGESVRLGGSTDRLRMNPRHLTVAVAMATVVGTASAWITSLSIYYRYGMGTAHVEPWRTALSSFPFTQLQDWLTHREWPHSAHLGGAAFGVGMVGLLSVLRMRFFWWPFHPIGYVVANTTTLNGIWFPMFIGWVFKAAIIRYGGIRGYRAALPFFLGLTLGEYAISGILALISLVTGTTGYRTYP